MVCRNFYNLYALDFYHPELINKFCDILAKNSEFLGELDLNNAIVCLKRFDHLHFEGVEALIKRSIELIDESDVRTMATMCYSLASLDIKNGTYFQIV